MTKDGLKHLAAFLPEFDRPDFSAGEMRGGDEIEPGVLRMHFASHSELVRRFIEAAYQHGWVRQGFDWTTWADSNEARLLREDESALKNATAKQLSCLLTLCIRQDRFVAGSLLADFESGLMLRIARRAAALVSDRSPRAREK
jgi:hypothetical protein